MKNGHGIPIGVERAWEYSFEVDAKNGHFWSILTKPSMIPPGTPMPALTPFIPPIMMPKYRTLHNTYGQKSTISIFTLFSTLSPNGPFRGLIQVQMEF